MGGQAYKAPRGVSTFRYEPENIKIAGLHEEETRTVAEVGEEERRLIGKLTMVASNRELATFWKDPNDYFRSYPDEVRRSRMLAICIEYLRHGQLATRPLVVEIEGVPFVINGRHSVTAATAVKMCLNKKLVIDELVPYVLDVRKSRGAAWRPPPVEIQPPPKSALSGKYVDFAWLASVANSVNVPTMEELFELALPRFYAARAAEQTPDFAEIGRMCNVSAGVAEDWEKLDGMHDLVKRYVLVGTPAPDGSLTGPRYNLSAAVKFAGRPPEQQVALINGLLTVGDTRVASAAATATEARKVEKTEKAARSKPASATAAAVDSAQPELAPRREPSEPRTREAADDFGGSAKPEKPASKSAPIVRAPWGVSDLSRFVKANPDAPVAVKAILRLLQKGPDKLDGLMVASIPGLEAYITAPTKKSTAK